jgi:hypothetical protein
MYVPMHVRTDGERCGSCGGSSRRWKEKKGSLADKIVVFFFIFEHSRRAFFVCGKASEWWCVGCHEFCLRDISILTEKGRK